MQVVIDDENTVRQAGLRRIVWRSAAGGLVLLLIESALQAEALKTQRRQNAMICPLLFYKPDAMDDKVSIGLGGPTWIAVVQNIATASAGLQDCYADFVQSPATLWRGLRALATADIIYERWRIPPCKSSNVSESSWPG
jgi:hypothetical protein